MKKLLVLSLIVTFMGILAAGCESGEVLFSVNDNGEGGVNGSSGGEIPIGGATNLQPNASPTAEDEESSDDSADDAAASTATSTSGNTSSGSGKTNDASTSSGKVKISKASNTCGSLVLGVEIKCQASLSGGSKEFEAELIDAPAGITVSVEKSTVKLVGKPTQLGSFSAKLTVWDKNNPTNKSAEKALTMNVKENIAINLYHKDEDGQWIRLDPTSGDNFTNVVLPPLETLRMRVISNTKVDEGDEATETSSSGAKYVWRVNGVECEGVCGDTGLNLQFSTTEGGQAETLNRSVVYISAVDDSATLKDVEVSVTDEAGSEDSVTIFSLTYEEDPCKTPLTVNTPSIELDDFRKLKHELAVNTKIKGGMAPYSWKLVGNPTVPTIIDSDSLLGVDDLGEGYTFSLGPQVDIDVKKTNVVTIASEGTSDSVDINIPVTIILPYFLNMKQVMDGIEYGVTLQFSDSCEGETHSQTVDIPITLKNLNVKMPTILNDLYMKMNINEIGDTWEDGSSYMKVIFEDENDNALGCTKYELREDSPKSALDENNFDDVDCDVGNGHTSADITSIKDIKLLFHDDENGCTWLGWCGTMDANLRQIYIYNDEWVAFYNDEKVGDKNINNDVTGDSEEVHFHVLDDMLGIPDDPNDDELEEMDFDIRTIWYVRRGDIASENGFKTDEELE